MASFFNPNLTFPGIYLSHLGKSGGTCFGMCQILGGHPWLLPPAVVHVRAVLVAGSVWEGTAMPPAGASAHLSQVPRFSVPGTTVWREEWVWFWGSSWELGGVGSRVWG